MAFAKENKINSTIRLSIFGLVIVDLLTKERIFGASLDTLYTTPVLNNGGAWSIDIQTPVIIVLTMLACIGLIYLFAKKTITTISFIILFSGALGNLYDRLVFQGVRDWIHIGIFPVFNLADVMLTIGVILIAWQYKQQSRKARL